MLVIDVEVPVGGFFLESLLPYIGACVFIDVGGISFGATSSIGASWMIVDILIAKMSSISVLAFSLSVLSKVLKTCLHGISKPSGANLQSIVLHP